jgi:uncharacterized membrane protein YbaN (DUF454 family)
VDGARRLAWQAAGALALVLAIVGIALPLLPTTPFLLLSAFCFARGSERLHDWLVTHPRLGPPIRAWREHRAISTRAKQLAIIAIVAAFAGEPGAGAAPTVLAIQAAVLVLVALFILTRPAPPPDGER